MDELLSATQAAERMGVPKTTVVGWLRSLPIPATTDSRGRYRLGPDALETLERIQNLRGDGAGFDTIRTALTNADNHQDANATHQTSANDVSLAELLRAERERSAALADRVAELSALAAAHQTRAQILADRVALLEANTQRTPWWQFWTR